MPEEAYDIISSLRDDTPPPDDRPQPRATASPLALRMGYEPWSDERLSLQDRAGSFFQNRLQSRTPWEQAAREAADHLNINPEPMRRGYEQDLQMQEVRGRYEGRLEPWAGWLGRRTPVAGSVVSALSSAGYNYAVQRFNRGEATPEDMHAIARYERRQEIETEQGRTVGGQIAEALSHVPAMVGEAVLAGGIVGRAGLALGQTARGAGIAARVGPAGTWAARTAGTAALMPGMYLPEWQQRNIAEGRDPGDVRALGPVAGMAFINTAVLGSLGGLGNRITAAGVKGFVGRLAARTATGVAEQSSIDLVADVISDTLPKAYRLRTEYGTLYHAFHGEWGPAWKQALVQAVTFAAFSLFHGAPRRPERDLILEATERFANDMAAQRGITREEAGQRMLQVENLVQQAGGRAAATELVRQTYPIGPERAFGVALAENMRFEAPQVAAQGPEPGIDRISAAAAKPPPAETPTPPPGSPTPKTKAQLAVEALAHVPDADLAGFMKAVGLKPSKLKDADKARAKNAQDVMNSQGGLNGLLRLAERWPKAQPQAQEPPKTTITDEVVKEHAALAVHSALEETGVVLPQLDADVSHLEIQLARGKVLTLANIHNLESWRRLSVGDSMRVAASLKESPQQFVAHMRTLVDAKLKAQEPPKTAPPSPPAPAEAPEAPEVAQTPPAAPPTPPVAKVEPTIHPELQAAFDAAGLTPQERHVLYERGVHRRTLEDIAADPIFGGVSREAVRKIEAKARGKLGMKESLTEAVIKPEKEDAFLGLVERGQERHGHFDQETGNWVREKVSPGERAGLGEISNQFDPETNQRLARKAKKKLSAIDQAYRELELLSDRMMEEIDKGGPLLPERKAFYEREIARQNRITQGEFAEEEGKPSGLPEKTGTPEQAPVRRVRAGTGVPETDAPREGTEVPVAGQTAEGPAQAPGGGAAEWAGDAPAPAERGPAGGHELITPEERSEAHAIGEQGNVPTTQVQDALTGVEAEARQQAAVEARLQAAQSTPAQRDARLERLERLRRRQRGEQPAKPGEPTGGEPGGVGLPQPPTEEQRRAGSVGGGQPDAGEARLPQRETALANVQVNLERVARELDHLVVEGVLPNRAVRDEVMRRLAADPEAGAKLVDSLAANPRPTDVYENGLLLQRRVALHNERDGVILEANAEARRPRAERDQAKIDELDAKERVLAAQLDVVDRVTNETGTETARSLQFRQRMMAADYSLSGMTERAERARGERVEPGSPEAELIADLHKQIKDLRDELKKLEDSGQKGTAGWHDKNFKYVQVKAKFDSHIEAWRLANTPWHVKAWRLAGEVVGAVPRAVMASIDFPLLRQGLLPLITHPIATGKAIPEMFRSFFSEEVARRAEYDMKTRQGYLLGDAAGVDMTSRHGPSGSREEGFLSRLIGRAENIPYVGRALNAVNFVKASERAYSTVMNRVRTSVFDAMVGSLAQGGKINLADAKVIANYVNTITGRGSLGALEGSASKLSYAFFAPKWTVSRFQVLLGLPLFSHFSENAPQARKLIALEYAKMVGGFGLMAGLAALAGFDLEKDPRSSDFGKLKVGNTRLDMTGGLAGAARFLSQTFFAAGSLFTKQPLPATKDSKGRLLPLTGPLPYGADDWAATALHFGRQKLAPAPAAVFNLLSASDVAHRPVTPASQAASMVTPLFARDVYEAMADLGFAKGTAVSLLGLLGMSMATYDPNAPRTPPTAEERRQLQEVQRIRHSPAPVGIR